MSVVHPPPPHTLICCPETLAEDSSPSDLTLTNVGQVEDAVFGEPLQHVQPRLIRSPSDG